MEIREIERIREEACEWVIRLEHGSLSETDTDQFLQWLDRSHRHREEFTELVALWGNMDSMSSLADVIPVDSHRSADSEPAASADSSPAWLATIKGFLDFGWGFKYPAAIATFAVISLVSILYVSDGQWANQLFGGNANLYATHVGEQKIIGLPDGSTVNLNTNSEVEVVYSDRQRKIYLKRGEAHFAVQHNPQRPFVVYVGTGSVTAVGTAFNIEYNKGFVDVIVTDGVVEVESSLAERQSKGFSDSPVDGSTDPNQKIVTKTRVKVGHKAVFDEIVRSVKVVDSKDIERELAWQAGNLIFEGDRLEDVIAEVTRYTKSRIVIHGAALRDLQIGGSFKTGETDAMLDALQSSFGIAVTRMSDNLVVLSKKREVPQG